MWLVVAWAALGLAHPAPKVYWAPYGGNVTRFERVVDQGTPTNLNLPTPNGTACSVTITSCARVMVTGTRTVLIRACNRAALAAAAGLIVVRL
jgi:hypothetical protein